VLKVVAPETSARMKRVRQYDTAPELAVRRILTAMGVSYRTCARDLPGNPDVVNRKAGWALFVHGCFWHGHAGCRLFTVPKTNKRFWSEKVASNRKRDARKARALRARGFRVITVWQCETQRPEHLARRLRRILDNEPSQMGGNDGTFLRSPKPKLSHPQGELRIVDLFSGCGGLTLGVGEAARLSRLALVVRLAVEVNPAAVAAYAANFSPANGAAASDITDWFDQDFGSPLSLLERRTRRSTGPVDLLVGGPPCQGHSTLNNRTRGDDPKNALYLTMVRAAEVLCPRALIIENVPALQRDSAGTLELAVKRLGLLGYKVDHGVVSVAGLGVPQLRKRHVLIAHAVAQPDLEAAMNQAHAPVRTLRWAIGDLAGLNATTPFDRPSLLSRENRKRADYLLRTGRFDLPNSRRPRCQRDLHKYKSMYGRLSWVRPAQTITTGFGSPGQGRYLHPSEARTLTPHEAARIQFFPDWYDFSSLTYQLYLSRAIGNAVPPKLAFVMALHVLALAEQASLRTASRLGRRAAVIAVR
jgi:DNA (cytosine-5)-methyltransferase 1